MHHTINPETTYAHLKNKVNWAVCDKCGWNWPETKLNLRGDGHKICPNHSTYKESSEEISTRYAKRGARLARRREPQPRWPHPPEMRDVSGVESITPPKITLINNAGSKTLTIRGRNLSAADFQIPGNNISVAGISFTPIDPETRGNTVTYILYSVIATPGDYDLTIAGNVFKKVIEVRA